MMEPTPSGKLATELAALAASLEEFGGALHGINDPALNAAFRPLMEGGPNIVAKHREKPGTSIADDMAGLRSVLRMNQVPREDPELGRMERLTALRNARAALLADLEDILVHLAELGLTPTKPDFDVPPAAVLERAAVAGLMLGVIRRLGAVEDSLVAVKEQAKPAEAKSPRQIGLINFYLGEMDVQLALARIEALSGNQIDFASLGRAVDTMGGLTRDFIASVNGMVRSVNDGLRVAARRVVPPMQKLVRGTRTLIKAVWQRGQGAPVAPEPKPALPDPTPEPPATDTAFWDWIDRGDEAMRIGTLRDAREAYAAAFSAAEFLVQSDPGNSEWQRDLSVSHDKLGDIAKAEGDLPAARAAYAAGLAIAEQLTARDKGNSELQRDLSVSHNKLGDIAVAEGDLPAARAAYEADLAIAKQLAARDKGNSLWQRDLAVSHEKLGDIARAEGDLPAVRAAYEASLTIREQLAARDKGNSLWQGDLAVSHDKLGDIAQAEGDLPAARAAYAAGLAIREQLAARDPANSEWQRDLSISHNKLGDVAQAEGDLPAARAAFAASLAIREQLAARDKGNSEWQRDLCIGHQGLGNVAAAMGDTSLALQHFEQEAAIIAPLVDRFPGNPRFSEVLAYAQRRLKELAE